MVFVLWKIRAVIEGIMPHLQLQIARVLKRNRMLCLLTRIWVIRLFSRHRDICKNFSREIPVSYRKNLLIFDYLISVFNWNETWLDIKIRTIFFLQPFRHCPFQQILEGLTLFTFFGSSRRQISSSRTIAQSFGL
jgi:hypothetical protein